MLRAISLGSLFQISRYAVSPDVADEREDCRTKVHQLLGTNCTLSLSEQYPCAVEIFGNLIEKISKLQGWDFDPGDYDLRDSTITLNGICYCVMVDNDGLYIGTYRGRGMSEDEFKTRFKINGEGVYERKDVTIESPGTEDTKVKKWVKLEGKEES